MSHKFISTGSTAVQTVNRVICLSKQRPFARRSPDVQEMTGRDGKGKQSGQMRALGKTESKLEVVFLHLIRQSSQREEGSINPQHLGKTVTRRLISLS